MDLLELHGALVPERRVPPQRVVEGFDVLEDGEPRRVAALEGAALHEFGLERRQAEETGQDPASKGGLTATAGPLGTLSLPF